MSKLDSTQGVVKSVKCEGETPEKTSSSFFQRPLSEETSIRKPRRLLSSKTKIKNIKVIPSRLSPNFRLWRRKRPLVSDLESKRGDQIVHRICNNDIVADNAIIHEEFPEGKLNIPALKKNSIFSRKFPFYSFRRKEDKDNDNDIITTGTQTTPVDDSYNIESRNPSSCLYPKTKDKVHSVKPQTLQIIISGRKIEWKSCSSGVFSKAVLRKSVEGSIWQLLKLNTSQSEVDKLLQERSPDYLNHQHCTSLIYTVASPTSSRALPPETKGPISKTFHTPRLIKQASREEFPEEDKPPILHLNTCQERGTRFRRPKCEAALPTQKSVRDEQLLRLEQYVNKLYPQTVMCISDREASCGGLDTAERRGSSGLRELIGENRDFSLCLSANGFDSDSDHISDAGRRRIKFVGQPTFYTDEEREILDGKRQVFANFSKISEYSLELDQSNETQMPAFGDLVMGLDNTVSKTIQWFTTK